MFAGSVCILHDVMCLASPSKQFSACLFSLSSVIACSLAAYIIRGFLLWRIQFPLFLEIMQHLVAHIESGSWHNLFSPHSTVHKCHVSGKKNHKCVAPACFSLLYHTCSWLRVCICLFQMSKPHTLPSLFVCLMFFFSSLVIRRFLLEDPCPSFLKRLGAVATWLGLRRNVGSSSVLVLLHKLVSNASLDSFKKMNGP